MSKFFEDEILIYLQRIILKKNIALIPSQSKFSYGIKSYF